MKYKILITILLLLFSTHLYAGEKEIISLAKNYYSHQEYFSSITELMRYQCLYTVGRYYPLSMVMMGKAYFKGKNLTRALEILQGCSSRFPGTGEGEEALYLRGYINLYAGLTGKAQDIFQEYLERYNHGKFAEDIYRDNCFGSAFKFDLQNSLYDIELYRYKYPAGKYMEDMQKLEKSILQEINRPRKKLWLSVLGSIIFPGFGYLYTGKYGLGVLTFFTNALFGYLIYNGYRTDNIYQMVFFGILGFSFYQYNIYGAIRSVREFNNRDAFYRAIRLGLSTSF